MSWRLLTGVGLSFVVSAVGLTQFASQPKPRECPVASLDMSTWVITKDADIGIEMKHPSDYRVKHWESRSDTSGASLAFRRNAVSTIDINEFQGFYSSQGPKASIAPCLIRTRSVVLPLHVERTVSILWDGRDTLYFVAKAIFTPTGKPRMLLELGAPDSTGLLEQMAILRTMRFLNDR